MAAGDVVNGITAAVANNAYLAFQPSSGVEVAITQIFIEDAGTSAHKLFIYDGTTYVKSFVTGGAQAVMNSTLIGINNTRYLAIKNESGGAAGLGYTGWQTK